MIDLHTHTTYSDGDYTPLELIDLAVGIGLSAMSITDHDTINAYKKTDVVEYAKKRSIRLIPGIELSTIDVTTGQKIHVVGLNLDLNNKILNELCDDLYKSRLLIMEKVAIKLGDMGLVLRVDDLKNSSAVITKSHIASDVLSNPSNHDKLLKFYGHMPLQGTFIEDYLIRGKPGYVEDRDKLSTSRAVEVIKMAGGKSICAHPSFNVMKGFGLKDMQDLILDNRFDGLEAINIQYDKSNNDTRFDMVQEFTDFANSAKLLISGGSDFHSNNDELWGNHSDLGLKNEDYIVNDEILELILL
jgi:3',5'-nucleoside bisphosphate phosphatase